MINRTIIRTRVIQTLYAYYECGDKTSLSAKKELLKSFSDTYSLYMLLLDFINELTSYAESMISDANAIAKATHTEYKSNRKFVENKFAMQVFNNYQLRNYISEQHLSWEAGLGAAKSVYQQLIIHPAYIEYMSNPKNGYAEDKKIWRKIFSDIIPNNEGFYNALEEVELNAGAANWQSDLETIISYVLKTIKKFNEGNGAQQLLLEMFENEPEVEFATSLLQKSIDNYETTSKLISEHLKNWDMTRIAFMDKIILQAALTEIMNYPDIALQISLNEYIEIAKEYSGEKSHIFINGILNEILQEMKANNTLLKAMTIK